MKKHLNAILAQIAASAILAAAAMPAAAAEGAPARIRFIGNGLIGLSYYPGATCIEGDGIVASNTVTNPSQALAILFNKAQNVSLGMPATPNVVNLKDWDVTLSKGFYKEYAVTPGQPLAIRHAFHYFSEKRLSPQMIETTTADCNAGSYFNPEPGKNYEATMQFDGGACRLNLMEIDVKGEEVTLIPVQRRPAPQCSARNATGDAAPVAQVARPAAAVPAANGIDMGRRVGASTAETDAKVDAMIARRRAVRGLNNGATAQCPDCPQTYEYRPSYVSVVLPQTEDMETNAWLHEIEPDLNQYLVHNLASFALPGKIVPMPCKGAEDDLRRAANLLDLDELPAENVQSFRGYHGPDANTYHRDLRSWPVRAACKNGRLHGDVEAWVFSHQVKNLKDSLQAIPMLTHVRFSAVDGKAVGIVQSASRSEGVHMVDYKSSASGSTLSRDNARDSYEKATFEFRHADKPENPRKVTVEGKIYSARKYQKLKDDNR